ncbi:MAG: tRNA uridine-5-carboxymethylaminomethyl(34) synthesis GTPase MnmE [Clostridia bacterium]|nr:tRNA uridine-5-carboxymethylaminomethyl(34) synthesis GTPase MnmE [Clostridia bacterium]
MKVYDTIAAISTPRGKGGIAVIRISGEECVAILKRVFVPCGKDPVEYARRACFGHIVGPDGDVIDEGLVTYFATPHSFTGENVAEISCHGGVLLTETVLGAVLAAGARPATAGEFTARAMLNGKMGLASAEALGALLEAGTKGQMLLARGGMEGKLADATSALYERLTAILSDIYAKVDFPDEDLNSMSEQELRAALLEVRERTAALAATWHTGRAVSDGVRTVICGPVNAGKSTLYNAIVGRDAAIVTDIAGTTRDIISETAALGQVTLHLSDTAGLRDTEDAVEKIGVARADAAIDEAELVLLVLDGSKAPDGGTRALIERLKRVQGTVVAVLNKEDRGGDFPSEVLADFAHVVKISAKTGDISPLSSLVERLYTDETLDIRNDAVVANARQFAALVRAAEALDAAIAALDAGIPLDASCVEAELALSAFGEVDGRAVGEDIVANIFSRFCVGK